MATNQNNIHINSFSKGMNTDTSLDMVGNEQYVFGQNVRITANALLQGAVDSNSKEGTITPVPSGQADHGALIDDDNLINDKWSILGIATLGDIGAIITKDVTSHWHIYRINYNKDDDQLTFDHLFGSANTTSKNKFSVVINRELENVVKLYIADGKHQIMSLNIHKDDDNDKYIERLDNEEQLVNNNYFPTYQVAINNKITGTLKTGQVQYTYRFYHKYGISSKLAPLTSKIQVIDPSRSKEIGNAEDTQTTIGFQLKIYCPQEAVDVFDHIQIYRLSYIKPNSDAEVNLIYDSKLPTNPGDVKINDNGLESLQQLSIQEFAAIDSINIVPECIEQNQNYLFAADIEDNTRLRFDEGQFDAKAYQCADDGKIYLYKNGDTTYEYEYQFDDVYSINEDCTLNAYSDMTIDRAQYPIQHECKYCKESSIDDIAADEYFTPAICGIAKCNRSICGKTRPDIIQVENENYYLGGTGKNVSWRFVTTNIPLDSAREYDAQHPPKVESSYTSQLYYLKRSGNSIVTENAGISTNDVFADHNILANKKLEYNDMFTSSVFRSLRRDEVYRYGIVLYDKHGTRSDVQWIADIRTPSEEEFPSIKIGDYDLGHNRFVYARPIGIQFSVHNIDLNNISAYQIVRCAKTADYTKNLMQCVVSRPERQSLPTSSIWKSDTTRRYSPYYPLPFLTSDYINTIYGTQFETTANNDYFLTGDQIYSDSEPLRADNLKNKELFQIFSPEIQFVQDDALTKLQSFVLKMHPVTFVFGKSLSAFSNELTHERTFDAEMWEYLKISAFYSEKIEMIEQQRVFAQSGVFSEGQRSDILFTRNWVKGADQYDAETPYDKNDLSFVQKYYNRSGINIKTDVEIRDVKNVSNPTWEQGFDSINGAGGTIVSGVKAYKSYSTSISSFEYNNWVSNGMYDLRIGSNLSSFGPDCMNVPGISAMIEPGHAAGTGDTAWTREPMSAGWIGPGPRCFLATIKNDNDRYLLGYDGSSVPGMGAAIVNITHVPTQYAGLTREEKQYDVYYGFGNIKNITDSNNDKFNVFDGDVYITPCEIISMYKTYDFNSYDTLPSAQFIYYVPMESVVNTYFDYGMGFRNTESKTVQIEPGEIGGIVSQARPEHQYNMIYSDNNMSNDIYTVQTLEDNNKNYPQRIHYSTLKTNGELIDNWQMFKALDYIDADTRYGQITNMLTNKDVIYFWQNQAFGKLSVNERSLVTDNNSNTVQLGQGGVLQRTDYVDTRYGMRPEDYSAISAEGSIYWIDIMNKAIVMSNGQSVINLGEQLNVQSYINANISDNIPTIHYDLQNNELLCKCLKDGKQMVFNIKLNVATSVYDREYEDIIVFNNVLFGIIGEKLRKYNYIQGTPLYERQTKLEFVVNPSAGVTKTFDNQEIVTMYRGPYVDDNSYMKDKQFSFTTNIIDTVQKNPDGCTDREGNVRYAIPRYAENYGNRMRGKWMKVDIEDYKPKYEHSISHILTKFRQSFS